MSNESGYLAAIKRANQERAKKGTTPSTPQMRGTPLSPAEREAQRWAAETAKAEIRSIVALQGSRFAVLLKLSGASGGASFALEGFPSKDLLVQRIKKAQAMNEEVVGAYEVNNGRPLKVVLEGEAVKFEAGTPRPGARPLSPEKMLRLAQVEAEKRAKERPKERDIMGGGRGGKR